MTNLALSIALQASLLTAGGHTHNYKEAYNNTVQSGRPLLVLIGAEWCPGCRTMKNSVIPALEKKGKLAKVEFAYVNADSQGDLAGKLMSGTSIPQLIIFQKNGKGWTRHQLTGPQSVEETVSFVNQGVTKPASAKTSRQ